MSRRQRRTARTKYRATFHDLDVIEVTDRPPMVGDRAGAMLGQARAFWLLRRRREFARFERIGCQNALRGERLRWMLPRHGARQRRARKSVA